MKKTWKIFSAMSLLALFIALPYMSAHPNDPPKPADTNKATSAPVHNWKLPDGFTPDEAYKDNCTRCHTEVPKMGPRRTRTVMNHMRVRANLTRDEAEAIYEYLTK